jgi:hypothetical protein
MHLLNACPLGLVITLSGWVLACARPAVSPNPTSSEERVRSTPTIQPDLPLPPDAFNLDVTSARIVPDTRMSVQERVESYGRSWECRPNTAR